MSDTSRVDQPVSRVGGRAASPQLGQIGVSLPAGKAVARLSHSWPRGQLKRWDMTRTPLPVGGSAGQIDPRRDGRGLGRPALPGAVAQRSSPLAYRFDLFLPVAGQPVPRGWLPGVCDVSVTDV